MFSAMKQVKQLKISGWPTIFGRDQKNLSFWPFLACEGCLGGLKDPLEVRVQHETYRSMSGTYVQAILSQKNWTGLAGVLRNGRNQSKYDFCSVGWPLLVKNPFFSNFGQKCHETTKITFDRYCETPCKSLRPEYGGLVGWWYPGNMCEKRLHTCPLKFRWREYLQIHFCISPNGAQWGFPMFTHNHCLCDHMVGRSPQKWVWKHR